MIAQNVKLIHQGNYLSYYEINYLNEKTGDIKPYEIVSKQGSKFNNSEPLTLKTLGKNVPAVMLVVFNKDHSKMLLNKEFRLGVNSYVYNLTAGLIDPGETPEEAAKRELFEETGLTLTSIIRKLPNAFSSAPVTDDFIPTFICEAEGEIRESDNPFEVIHSSWHSKSEVYQMVTDDKCIFSSQAQAFAYMWSTSFIS